jgi:hypothetical protein
MTWPPETEPVLMRACLPARLDRQQLNGATMASLRRSGFSWTVPCKRPATALGIPLCHLLQGPPWQDLAGVLGALVVAMDVDAAGCGQLLGLKVEVSETEGFRSEIIAHLKGRGLRLVNANEILQTIII